MPAVLNMFVVRTKQAAKLGYHDTLSGALLTSQDQRCPWSFAWILHRIRQPINDVVKNVIIAASNVVFYMRNEETAVTLNRLHRKALPKIVIFRCVLSRRKNNALILAPFAMG